LNCGEFRYRYRGRADIDALRHHYCGRREPGGGQGGALGACAYAAATALWLQLGIASAEARAIAETAGLLYVEDRCLIIEQRRLGLEAPRA